ncbi:MAG: hypothetical protein K0S09_709 [Sphingobacteriaceae bacterium]|jgi:hypothetical protein|nr:hypothetical protein [Sphingobacteriaceae bacterium]
MLLEDFKRQYSLNDGAVESLTCNFKEAQLVLRLKVKRLIDKKPEPCIVELVFSQVWELNLLDHFDNRSYSDIVFVKIGGIYYVSFDPYGNSGQPAAGDNFVIKSGQLVFQGEILN